MARLPNFLVIIRSEKLSGKGQGRGGRGAKKRTFRFGKKNVSFPKVETFRFADYRNANPDMILYIFLPILIFDAAYELDVHIFRKTLTNATILSVPGVIIAMLLTAALMIGIGTFAPSYEGWNWTFALMFGALISATDPVAVVALLKELGTSKRFSTLVDAESMLNDGTGIVLFMLFFGAYTATGVSDSPVADFIIVSIVHYSYKNQ